MKKRHLVTIAAATACCFHSIDAAFSASSKQKSFLPKDKTIQRRKSPALWRELEQTSAPLSPKDNEIPLLSKPPQVMAPCGGWEQLQAAIANGADAVYLGLSTFSARARAANFDPMLELPKAVELAHHYQVHVYVALNTLVFGKDELQQVQELLKLCDQAQVDAVIVQDVGICQLASEVVPNLTIHASTQQSITDADGALFASQMLNTKRVVLGRELSLSEIDTISQNTQNVELETFVHGALCVSYSGQCFSSEAWGGRSANRGQCAQACRLPYGLIRDGQLHSISDDLSYLLSPQDLCGLEAVPSLLKSGVTCLKIEGRLKDAHYVAATTRAYRQAVDEAWKQYCQAHQLPPHLSKTRSEWLQLQLDNDNQDNSITRSELQQVFSRGQDSEHGGLTMGFFEGPQHQTLVRGNSPRHRGVFVGTICMESSAKCGLIIQLSSSASQMLQRGDGIVIDRGNPQDEELGGAIYDVIEMDGNDSIVKVQLSRATTQHWKQLDADRMGNDQKPMAPIGANVWKTSDAKVDQKLRKWSRRNLQNIQPPSSQFDPAVTLHVIGSVGSPLKIEIRSIQDPTIVGVGTSPGTLQEAQTAALSLPSIQKAVGTLGNTPFTLESDSDDSAMDMSQLDDNLWCPVSWIKKARRDAIEDLQAKLKMMEDKDDGADDEVTEPTTTTTRDVVSEKLQLLQQEELNDDSTTAAVTLSVLARDIDQVQALCDLINENADNDNDNDSTTTTISEIMIDFLELDGMREAVNYIRDHCSANNIKVVIASPRILKPNESGLWRTLLKLQPDALLIRSPGLLYRLQQLGGTGATIELDDANTKVTIPEFLGDFSLNVANALTAYEFLEYGCKRVTASYDLSANAITELLETVGPARSSRIEVVTHCHMPIFHTE